MSFPPRSPQLPDINTGDHGNDVAGSDQIDPLPPPGRSPPPPPPPLPPVLELIGMWLQYFENNEALNTENVDILSHPPPHQHEDHEDEEEEELEGQLNSSRGAAATERVEYYMPYDPLDFTHLSPSVSVGLSEEVVATFLNLNLNSTAAAEGEVCSVCLDEVQSSRKLILLPRCRHAFHAQCIGKWLLNNNTCPLCKSIALHL